MESRRALIFANGEIGDYNSLRSLLQPLDLLVAADGGLRHLKSLEIMPSVLIGDLDSVTQEEVREAKATGVEVIQYPVHKDETDLQLAINLVVERGYSNIVIVGALGGRLDHTLGNIFLLSAHIHSSVSIRLDDGREEIFLIIHTADISGSPGDIVSLLPLGNPVEHVTTEELQYPLVGETLLPDRTRGISNVMLSEKARVSVSSGILLCIHSRQKKPVN